MDNIKEGLKRDLKLGKLFEGYKKGNIKDVYRRNIIPVILTTLRVWGVLIIWILSRLSSDPDTTLIIMSIIYSVFYSMIKQIVIFYAHRYGIYMKQNKDKTVIEGFKYSTTFKGFVIDAGIYFILLKAISIGTSIVLGSTFGTFLYGIAISVFYTLGILGAILVGILLFFLYVVFSVLLNGITDSILVYLLTNDRDKREITEGVSFIKNNFIHFGVVSTVYRIIQIISVLITFSIAIPLIMPPIMEWRYNHWLGVTDRDEREFVEYEEVEEVEEG